MVNNEEGLKTRHNIICTGLLQENGNFPENKVISTALAKEASLKKYMKRVMPFVQVVKVGLSLAGWHWLASSAESTG